jgi:UDP:flavonoid glycosyltransferase YjiC (YdhE family)
LGLEKHKVILVAPLDWGMGHTTRSVPVIQHLRSQGHTVVFAGNDWQSSYISKTFGDIETIELDGYDVHYSHSGARFMISLFSQLPKLLKTIRHEHEWLLRVAATRHFDGIITDNRYGLYHPRIPSVIMTHQVLAQSGMGDIADRLTSKLHYKQLAKFNQCWVVDVPGKPNLAGKLAHPHTLPRNAQYIGLLSQIEQATTKKEHLLVLLSGPEPQRTMLSQILWKQVQQYKDKLVFIEGSNDCPTPENIPGNIQYHKRVTKEVLQPLLENASMVICRSGYSSLMDLAVLDKPAVLIPTPGQTEQEYLGRHLHKEGVFYCAPQKTFDLQKVLAEVPTFPFKKLPLQNAHTQYKGVIDNWLAKL